MMLKPCLLNQKEVSALNKGFPTPPEIGMTRCGPEIETESQFTGSLEDVVTSMGEEAAALLALYHATTDLNTKYLSILDETHCGWPGVLRCDKYGFVTSLRISFTASPPKEIGQLKQLRKLMLSGNIQTLPPEIGQLKALQILNLRDTTLETLPPEIGQLGSLHTLDLSPTSRLTTLPSEIGQLGNLKTLIPDELSINQSPQRDWEA